MGQPAEQHGEGEQPGVHGLPGIAPTLGGARPARLLKLFSPEGGARCQAGPACQSAPGNGLARQEPPLFLAFRNENHSLRPVRSGSRSDASQRQGGEVPAAACGRFRRGALALLLGVLAGCGGPPVSRPGRLEVITTVAPVTLFTRAVAGDCARVTPLLPPGGDAHAIQASPRDLLRLRRADVLVLNGLGLEAPLEPLLASADQPALRRIDSTRGLIAPGAVGAGAMAPVGLPGSPASGDGHAHGPINPHVWLDPRLALRQVETIRDGLIAADPSCAEGYRRRAAATAAGLRRLDRRLAADLAPLRGRTLLTSHDFAAHFARRYGLGNAWLVVEPESPAAPADLARLAALQKREGSRALLAPPGPIAAAFSGLARDLGVPILRFDPLESLSEAQLADPFSYERLMLRNAASVRQAIGPPNN